MHKRIGLIALALTWCLGCYDFVDPDFSDENNNAIFQVSVGENDRGQYSLHGTLVLGIDNDGLRRDVRNDTVVFRDLKLPPVRVGRNETRIYERLDTTGVSGPFTVVAPIVEGVSPLPFVRWPTVRRAGSDTLRITRGANLRLPLDVEGTQPQPRTPSQNWQVEIIGGSAQFFVGGRGIPPQIIEVSPNFLPPAPDSVFTALLTWSQSDQLRVSGYRGGYNYTQQSNWTVVIR